MTAVSLLGASVGGASSENPAQRREVGEAEARFGEIIGQVRERAAVSGEPPSNDGITEDAASSGDVAAGSGAAHADARDIAAAAALLGGVDVAAVDESTLSAGADGQGAEKPGADEHGTGEHGADEQIIAAPGAGETSTTQVDPTSIRPFAESPAVTTAVEGSEMRHDQGVRAAASAVAPAAASAVVSDSAGAPQVGRGAASAVEAQGPSTSGRTAAVAPDSSSDAEQPRLSAQAQSSGSSESGAERDGASASPTPTRTLSSLPAPMGSYAEIRASAESAASGTAPITDVELSAGDRGVSVAVAAATAGTASSAASGASSMLPMAPVLAPSAPLAVAPDVTPDGARTVAAQVAPAVLSIAQRPAGAHQLTMTLNPDSLGPVTVRANIGQAGDVQVELIGATDAGRDALRSLVADLRRDLASVSPHATLSVSTAVAADTGAGRGGHPGSEAAAGEQGAPRDGASPQRDRRAATDRTDDLAQVIRISTSTFAGSGEGLDTFA